MPRQVKPLSTLLVERVSRPGEAAYLAAVAEAERRGMASPAGAVRLSDGQGLYLVVEPTGSARWLFLFRWRGKLKEMGLGGLSKVSLKLAREKAYEARSALGRGENPIDLKRAQAAIPTFGEVADEVIAELSKGFKNPKHRVSWLRAIGAPRQIKRRKGRGSEVVGTRPALADALRLKAVDQITTDDVFSVLKPIWTTRHETASRLRGQIAQVLDAAKAAGHRAGENPAAWEGNLKHRLAARRKLTVGHRAALDYKDMPKFVADLRRREALSARALEFTILTAARAGEVLGMTWNEVDLEERLWIVPASRMKRGREHRVPLPQRVVEILADQALAARDPHGHVFTSHRKPLSENAMMNLIKRMGWPGITVHGMRSAFRDWAGDATSFPRDLAEQALSHAVGNEVELAYRRSDALERRRKMMEAWAAFCAGGAEVIELARTA